MTAEEALEVLAGRSPTAWVAGSAASAAEAAIERRRPTGSRVAVRRRGARLEIVDPPRACDFDSWVLPWVFWFWAQFVLPASTWLLGECGAAVLLLVLPAWAAIWAPACRRHFVRERVTIGRSSWRIEQQLALAGRAACKWREGGLGTFEASGRVDELRGADAPAPALSLLRHRVVLRDDQHQDFGFGESLGENREPSWLKEVINDHLRDVRAGFHDI